MKNLSDTELLILNWIWDKNIAVPFKEIKEHFLNNNGFASSTVSTYLTRLINKGYLKSEKFLQTTLYTPIIKRKDFIAQKTQEILNNLHIDNYYDFIYDLIIKTNFTNEQKQSIINALNNKT